MTAEDRLQIEVIAYLRMQYPKALSVHIANERATSPRQGALLKRKGVTAGMPDVMVFHRNGRENGLAIELKIGNNKPTASQKAVMDRLFMQMWRVAVCYTFEQAKQVIDEYFKNPKP